MWWIVAGTVDGSDTLSVVQYHPLHTVTPRFTRTGVVLLSQVLTTGVAGTILILLVGATNN